MSVIQIRRSGERLNNLSGVGMAQVGGLATTGASGLATVGKGIIQGVAGVNDYLKAQRLEDEMLANEKALQAIECLQRKINNPKDGVIAQFNADSTMLSNYVHDTKTFMDKLRTDIDSEVKFSELSASQQRLFDRKVASAFVNAEKSLSTTAYGLSERRSQTAASELLKQAEAAYAVDGSVDNANALVDAFNSYADAHHIDDSQREALVQEKKKEVASMAAMNRIASAQSVEEVNALVASLHGDGKDLFGEGYGAIVSELQPIEKAALEDKLKKQRSLIEHQEAQFVQTQLDNIERACASRDETGGYEFSMTDIRGAIAGVARDYPKANARALSATESYIQKMEDGRVNEAFILAKAQVEQEEQDKAPNQRLSLKAMAKAIRERLPSDLKDTDEARRLEGLTMKHALEAEEARIKDQYAIDIGQLINNTYMGKSTSTEEALRIFEHDIVPAYPSMFIGEDGEAKKASIREKIQNNRLSNVVGFREMLAGRYMDKDFIENVLAGAPDRGSSGVDQGVRNPFEISFNANGEIDVAKTFGVVKQNALMRAEDWVGDNAIYGYNAMQSLTFLSQAYNEVVKVAAENPTYTPEQLYKIFNELVPKGFDQHLIIQRWNRPSARIDFLNDTARLQAFANNQRFLESLYGEDRDVPVDVSISNAAKNKGKPFPYSEGDKRNLATDAKKAQPKRDGYDPNDDKQQQ